jgi:exodeoxyribonuclease VII large subunit
MAVPVRSDLLSRIATQVRRLSACWARGQEARRAELRAAVRALPTLDNLLAVPRQRLDTAADRLPRALRANAQIHHTQLSRIASRLSPQLLRSRIARCNEVVAAFGQRGERAVQIFLARRKDRMMSCGQLLTAYSYRGVLKRGFALVRDQKGMPLHAAAAVNPGMRLDVEFSDGRVAATADGVAGTSSPAPASPARPRTKTGNDQGGASGQGSLFG